MHLTVYPSFSMNILWYVMGRITKKTSFCKCENKGTDQCFCFHYIYSTIIPSSYIRSQASSHLLTGCSADFVPNLVRNPKDRFSHDTAEVNLTLTGGFYLFTNGMISFDIVTQKSVGPPCLR